VQATAQRGGDGGGEEIGLGARELVVDAQQLMDERVRRRAARAEDQRGALTRVREGDGPGVHEAQRSQPADHLERRGRGDADAARHLGLRGRARRARKVEDRQQVAGLDRAEVRARRMRLVGRVRHGPYSNSRR
jgi:hypothetical protein